ncbi:unnamed protein product [Hymenolepis diminuta]|uniref:Brix domain-containing protein n=1 Tax=Hymenolepis diminuta TaxID=6216 RepID=A0A0R3SY77_HYMDI|nr:unnamed protein product [Hymenolepis diminuta]VUZ55911.1 unnamed protein product [Hymenolepis diminuta]
MAASKNKGHRRHGKKRRQRQPRSALASHAAQERKLARAPHSFVFSRPGCGRLVKSLTLDIRQVFEPFTASQLRVSRRNVIKDFIAVAGPLHVSHILYFTHPKLEKLAAKRRRYAHNLEARKKQNSEAGESATMKKAEEETESDNEEKSQNEDNQTRDNTGHGGGVYMHLIRTPSGPSLTFRVSDYCLTRDIFTLVRKVFDVRQYSTPPLLAMAGFGAGNNQPPPSHLRLLVDMFQNMLPSLNIQKLKVSNVRRVLLLSREVDTSNEEGEVKEVIYLRHYNIRLENRSISRALRRLGMGGAPMKKQKAAAGLGPQGIGKSTGVPSLGKYTSMDEYLARANLLTDSAASELEDMVEVPLPGQPLDLEDIGQAEGACEGEGIGKSSQLPKSKDIKEAKAQAKSTHGFTHLSGCRKACVRLTEIGPRLTLQLIKIEEGVNSGTVLYHSWKKLTPQEVAQQEAEFKAKQALRAQRRTEHERRRKEKEAAKSGEAFRPPKQSVNFDDEKEKEQETEIHKLSDFEEEDDERQIGDEGERSESTMSKIKKKKRKVKKISKKHPAYNYLTERALEKKLEQKARRR